MAHGAVAVNPPSNIEITKVNRSLVFPGGLYSVSYFLACGQPVFDEAFEGWDVDCASGGSRGGEEWLAWSGVGPDGSFAFAESPVALEGFLSWSGFTGSEFGSLPEAFNAYGDDVLVGVVDDAVGGVAPGPGAIVANLAGVVLTACVDYEGGGVFY